MPRKLWTTEDLNMLYTAYEKSMGIRNKLLPLSPQLLAKFSRRACIKKAYNLKIFKEHFSKTIVKNISDINLAYLAGFIDGEGSITYTNFNLIVLKISNSNLQLLEWFKEIIGTGHIRQKKPLLCYTKKHYDLNISRSIDLYFLFIKLLPYVKIKHQKVKDAIDNIKKRFPYFNERLF